RRAIGAAAGVSPPPCPTANRSFSGSNCPYAAAETISSTATASSIAVARTRRPALNHLLQLPLLRRLAIGLRTSRGDRTETGAWSRHVVLPWLGGRRDTGWAMSQATQRAHRLHLSLREGPVLDRPALKSAVRAAIFMPAVFAFADNVIAQSQTTIFSA